MKVLKKWTWKTKKVSPQTIIDSAGHLQADKGWYEADLCREWRKAPTYLAWAEQAFAQKSEFGWDAALCYAKRAVCCQIDRFMMANHLGKFLDKRNYPQKMELLQDIGISLPNVLHELIIDPRNEIEHGYFAASEKQARQAVEICKMFLHVIEFEAGNGAIISLGGKPNHRFSGGGDVGKERQEAKYEIEDWFEPRLFIDCFSYSSHQVLLVYPKDNELCHCSLDDFTIDKAKAFVKILRQQHQRGSDRGEDMQERYFRILREDCGFDSLAF